MDSQNYHPALSSLSWLFGKWESVEAEVFYPTMETVRYTEKMEYLPTNEPYLEYKSETWHPIKNIKLHCERGFLRVDPDSNKIALVSSHHFGLSERSEGTVENQSFRMESESLTDMSFSKCRQTTKIIRKLCLKGEELYYTIDLQTSDQALQSHSWCRFKKRE